VAVLPTVWSNCLAGWWLGGADSRANLPFLFAGVTLLHLGGGLLNDAFDAEHDRLHHPDRLIPSGAVAVETVFRWALGLLAAGALTLLWIGQTSGALALVLVSLLVLRNALHRAIPLSPALDGLARLLLYVIGASMAIRGITGWSIWCGLALALYVTGAGCFAHAKPAPARVLRWPALLLTAPIVLALLMDAGLYRETGLLLSLVFALWLLRALRPVFWPTESETDAQASAVIRKTQLQQDSSTPAENRSSGELAVCQREPVAKSATSNGSRALSGFVAGIVFADWLAVCPVTLAGQDNESARELSLVFLGLFGLTLVLQRVVSARTR
jgi:4-hydroxybenzoate polyprenyltransferase